MPTIFARNGMCSKDAPIDRKQQQRIIEFLIQGGVNAILATGTTGEAATMTHEEQIGFISWVVGIVNGRVPVIAGCGANATREAVNLTKGARNAGADAALHVKPYYVKPTYTGMLAHFREIAKVGLPFITYSVSSRHGGGPIPIRLIAQLAKKFPVLHLGHKEAEGEALRFQSLRESCPDDFVIWSGDDSMTSTAMIDESCDGVISVAANIVPKDLVRMVECLAKKNGAQDYEGHAIAERLYLLFGDSGLFIETNPQPVKTALAMMGIIERACFRLPIVPMEEANVNILKRLLNSLGLLPG